MDDTALLLARTRVGWLLTIQGSFKCWCVVRVDFLILVAIENPPAGCQTEHMKYYWVSFIAPM